MDRSSQNPRRELAELVAGRQFDDEIEGERVSGDFEGLEIEATFFKCDFSGAVFRNCKFATSRFVDCDLSGVRLENCDLHKVWILRGSMADAQLEECNLFRCEISETEATQLRVKGGVLDHARLDLTGSDWFIHVASANGAAIRHIGPQDE